MFFWREQGQMIDKPKLKRLFSKQKEALQNWGNRKWIPSPETKNAQSAQATIMDG